MRKRTSEKRKLKFIIMALFVLSLAMYMLFQVWLKVEVLMLARELETLKRETLTLREVNNQLQTKVMDLSSYKRITEIAQKELGMIFFKQGELIMTDEVSLF